MSASVQACCEVKFVAWFVLAAPLTVNATGFSQWLMTNFKALNSFGGNSESMISAAPKFSVVQDLTFRLLPKL